MLHLVEVLGKYINASGCVQYLLFLSGHWFNYWTGSMLLNFWWEYKKYNKEQISTKKFWFIFFFILLLKFTWAVNFQCQCGLKLIKNMNSVRLKLILITIWAKRVNSSLTPPHSFHSLLICTILIRYLFLKFHVPKNIRKSVWVFMFLLENM